jgi:hypothetical protein
LRALRRRLKTGVGEFPPNEGFRNLVRKLELEAERLEQGRLEKAASNLGKPADRLAAAHANLGAYEAHLGSLSKAPKEVILAAFSGQTS